MVHRKYSFEKENISEQSKASIMSEEEVSSDSSVENEEKLTASTTNLQPRGDFTYKGLFPLTADVSLTSASTQPGSPQTTEDQEAVFVVDAAATTAILPRPVKEEAPVKLDPTKSPLWFCKFIVTYPKTSFGLTLSCHIFFVVTTIILLLMDYDIFPTNFKELPLDLRNDETYLRSRAWYYKKDHLPPFEFPELASLTELPERRGTDMLVLYFASDNVFTKQNLQIIQSIEKEFLAEMLKFKACQRNYKQDKFVCQEPYSVLRIFDHLDPTFSNISATLFTVYQGQQKGHLEKALAKDTVLTPTVAKSSATRVVFLMSSYIYKLHNMPVEDYLKNYFRERLDGLFKTGAGDMSVYYYNSKLFYQDVVDQVLKDLMLAIGSFLFIFFFMLFQTRSLLITCLAIGSIITSFLGTNLIYRVILDYKYFGVFHIISIFIILGVGADDIFVFTDTWQATAYENHPSPEMRLSSCYRRSTLSMFITSFTTCVAFLCNAFSPLMPISTFGLFSAILVTVNYISVITFFPTCIIMYHKTVENCTWPCCCPSVNKKLVTSSSVKDTGKIGHYPNLIVKFFRGPYHRLVTHKVWRWFFIFISVATLVPFIYSSFQMQLSKTDIQYYRNGHNYYYAFKLENGGFIKNLKEEESKVFIVFGMKTLDLSQCHKSDFKCRGHVVFDDSFDLNPKPAQIALLKFCDRLEKIQEQDQLYVVYDVVMQKVRVQCFIKEMDQYLRNVGADPKFHDPALNLSLPTSELKYRNFFAQHKALYKKNIPEDFNFYRYFETLIEYWLQEGYQEFKNPFSQYKSLLGEVADERDTSFTTLGTPYGTRLKYAAISVYINITSQTVNFQQGLIVHDAWEKFVNAEMKKLPSSVQGWQWANDELWHQFKRQEALMISAQQGICLGLGLSLIVLTIATSNIVNSLFASLCITCVTWTVCGAIPLFGWQISVIESINLTLIVGLAVDYVVHFAEAYHQSPHHNRVSKVRDMLESRGLSVLSGACTTLGASLFMMFAQIQFFLQFGIFMFLIIGFSCFYTLCLFTPVMSIIGPQGECGSIVPVFKWVWHKIIGRSAEDEDCKECKGKGFFKSSEKLLDRNSENETKLTVQ